MALLLCRARVDGRRAYHRAGFLDIYADDGEPEEREANYHYRCLTIRSRGGVGGSVSVIIIMQKACVTAKGT